MAKTIEKLVKAIKEKTASNESLTGADFLQLLNDQLVEIGAEPITLAQSQHLFSPEQESYLKVLHERENLLKSITTLGVATGQWVSQYKKDMTYREAMLVLAAVKDKMDVETTKATKTKDSPSKTKTDRSIGQSSPARMTLMRRSAQFVD
jgi:Sec-independent protein translocase protein TatA